MKTVKCIITTLVIVFGLSTSSFADFKYNAFTGQYENVGSNYTLEYNTFDNSWGYEKPGATLEYNSWSGEWVYER